MSPSTLPSSPDSLLQATLYPTSLRPEHIRPGNFIHYNNSPHNCPALIIDTAHDGAFAHMNVLLLDSMQAIEIHLGLGPNVPAGFTRSQKRSLCHATSREKAVAYVKGIVEGPHHFPDEQSRKALENYKMEAESFGLI